MLRTSSDRLDRRTAPEAPCRPPVESGAGTAIAFARLRFRSFRHCPALTGRQSIPRPAMSHPLRSAVPLHPEHPARPGLVSLVVVADERARGLEPSIHSALAQSYQELELLVVGCGATDWLRSAVEPFGARVHLLDVEEAGVAAGRNHALRRARGEFFAFMDPGDAWMPWRLEAQVAALKEYPEAVLAWTDMALVDDAGRVSDERHLQRMHATRASGPLNAMMRHMATLGSLGVVVPEVLEGTAVYVGDLFSEILLGNVLHSATVLMRRSAVERIGGFDPAFVRGRDDYEFYVRLCSAGPAVYLDVVAGSHRAGQTEQEEWSALLCDIARSNLRTIEKWMPHAGAPRAAERRAIRRRFADSYGWLGEAELDAGNRVAAGRAILASLARLPRIDRRLQLLLRCALPEAVETWLRARRAGGILQDA